MFLHAPGCAGSPYKSPYNFRHEGEEGWKPSYGVKGS